jgi:hypothetical protein
LLTGHFALNKLLGRIVYSSNDQLGGIDIMYTNGVSHQVVQDDLDGVKACINWLSYVPASRGAPVPLPSPAALSDPVDRKVGFVPPSTPYDPRSMIAGEVGAAGFFDKGQSAGYFSFFAVSFSPCSPRLILLSLQYFRQLRGADVRLGPYGGVRSGSPGRYVCWRRRRDHQNSREGYPS